MKARSIVFLFLVTLTAHYQSVKLENDLVVNYKMTDSNGKMKSAVVVKKDTIHYEWFEKEKVSRRMIVRDTVLENKLASIVERNRFWKFKSAKLAKPGPNVIFVYTKENRQKTIVIPTNAKPESKKLLFVKEFLEPILIKVFEVEIKNFPK